jgi:predicted PurR-regulated permease PerM
MVLKNIILYILICFFIILILSEIILSWKNNNLIEGIRNRRNRNKNINRNVEILSQKNAGNIEYLKDRIKEVDNMNSRINTIQENVDLMQVQINNLVEQQANYAQELAGDTPPTITGTEPMDVTDFE